jgi:hypothetical protein
VAMPTVLKILSLILWLTDLKTVISLYLLKSPEKIVNDDVCTTFWWLFLSWIFFYHPNMNLFLSTEITASPSVSALLAANSIFFNCLKSCPHLCLLNFKFLSHFAKRRHFHSMRHLQIGFNLFFTTESVKTPPFGLS